MDDERKWHLRELDRTMDEMDRLDLPDALIGWLESASALINDMAIDIDHLSQSSRKADTISQEETP